MYKLINNHFCHSIPVTFNGDFHKYYTRSRTDIRKSSATRIEDGVIGRQLT